LAEHVRAIVSFADSLELIPEFGFGPALNFREIN
jgi:hypothetical protein